MVKASTKRAVALVLGPALALAVASGTAFAGSSNVHVTVPFVKLNVVYTITAHGVAAGNKHLYLFIDSKRCGANPAIEFSRTGPNGTSFGYYIKSVSGAFSRPESFRTTARIKDHACAYLADSSAPKNGAGGVVARAFKTYTVH